MNAPFWAEHAFAAGEYDTRDEWLALRRTGIGSSDCSAILRMSKYASPWSVWLDKTTDTTADAETEAMMWGTLLEPVIRSELARRLGVTIDECPMLRSLRRPWQLYNPDGVIASQNAIVEIKNASAWLSQEWVDGEVPDHAELQVQHGCAVTGADGAYVAGLIGGNRLRWEYVPRDDHLIDDVIVPAEQHFWDTYVIGGAEPPIDGSDATADAIAARWPRRRDVELIADDVTAVASAVTAYQWALTAEKKVRDRKAEAVNQLTAMLQGADALTDTEGRRLVALKRGIFREKAFLAEEESAPEWLRKVEAVDKDRLKTEEPELYRRYQAASVYIPKG